MTDHIIDITYYPNVHQYTARAVYQYDKGWQLKISGLTTNKIIQVQYGIEGMAQTLNVDPEYQENCYIAKIPDVLLTQIKGIVAYVYVADASLGQTVCYIRIPITPREKPADYTYTQEETAGYAQLLAQLTQATKEVEELDKELEIIVDAATTATASAKEASQAANNAVAEFENIKQDVSSQISELEERIIELEENPPSALPEDWTPTIDNIEGLSDALSNIVEVSSEEPKDKNTELWVNPDSEELQIPQIDDKNISIYDTYSSHKIEELLRVYANNGNNSTGEGSTNNVLLSDADPKALGSNASSGTSYKVSREDHVHPMPSYSDINALGKDEQAKDSEKLGGQFPEHYAKQSKLDQLLQQMAKVLPTVTEAEAGKFLRVSSAGTWAAETVASAEGASF